MHEGSSRFWRRYRPIALCLRSEKENCPSHTFIEKGSSLVNNGCVLCLTGNLSMQKPVSPWVSRIFFFLLCAPLAHRDCNINGEIVDVFVYYIAAHVKSSFFSPL